jgi:hypothetical protein
VKLVYRIIVVLGWLCELACSGCSGGYCMTITSAVGLYSLVSNYEFVVKLRRITSELTGFTGKVSQILIKVKQA